MMTKEGSSRITGLDFVQDIERLTADFVGREWVFAEIDHWLAEPDAPRFFIITGEPGIGKSALAARLTQVRPVHAHHFCSARQGGTLDPIAFVRSVSYQLADRLPGFGTCLLEQKPSRFHINVNLDTIHKGNVYGVYINQFIIESRSAHDAFQSLVREPLDAWAAGHSDGEPVLLLVDALDEALQLDRWPTIVDLVDKARDLPEQVHWVLTSRPGEHLRTLSTVRTMILDDATNSMIDAQTYVDTALAEPFLGDALQHHGVDSSLLADELVSSSGGNFLYLHYVLADLRNAAMAGQAPIWQEHRPVGLNEIYHEHLQRVLAKNASDHWRQACHRVLGILAVAQEGLDFEKLCAFSRISPQDVNQVLNDVSQFLNSTFGDEGVQYRLYHSSFVDFLTDRDRNRTYWLDPSQYHSHIADYYWQAFSGSTLDYDRYSLSHLATHLAQAGQKERLCALVTRSASWMVAKVNAFASHEPLVGDLRLAKSFFADPISADELPILIQLHSVHRLVQQRAAIFRDTDLMALIWLDREAEAVGYARLREDPTKRFDGILAIHKAMTELGQVHGELLDEALTISKEIRGFPKLKALCAVAVAFSSASRWTEANAVLEEAQALAAELVEKHNGSEHKLNVIQLQIKGRLAEALIKTRRVHEALDLVTPILNEPKLDLNDIHMLSSVVVVLSREGYEQEASVILGAIQSGVAAIQPSWVHAHGLGHLVETLSQAGRRAEARQALDDMLSAVSTPSTDQDYRSRSRVLTSAVKVLAELGRFEQAKEIAEDIHLEQDHTTALGHLILALSEAGRFEDALEIANQLRDDSDKASVLSNVALLLARSGRIDEAHRLLDRLLDIQASVETLKEYDAALACVAVAVAQSGDFETSEALANSILDEHYRDKALGGVVTSLAQRQRFVQVQEVMPQIRKDTAKASSLAAVSVARSWAGQYQEGERLAEQMIEISQKIEGDWNRDEVLCGVPGALALAGHYDRALKMAHGFENELHQMAAFRGVVLAMACRKEEEERIAAVFDELDTVLEEEGWHGVKVATLCEMAPSLAKAGFVSLANRAVDKARTMALVIEESEIEGIRGNALGYVSAALHQLDRREEADTVFDEAQAATHRLLPHVRSEHTRSIASSLAKTGRFNQALDMLSLQSIDKFLGLLAQWAPFFESMKNGLSIKVLREAIRIAGWERKEWQDVYDQLKPLSS